MYVKIMAFVALLLLVSTERVSACSCAREELDQAVLRADYILVGTILSPRDSTPDSHGIRNDTDPVYFAVEVERMLKGEQSSPAIIVTNRISASCGYPFEQGTRYLIFGYHAEATIPELPQQKDVIKTNLCTLTTADKVDALATQIQTLLAKQPVSPTGDSNKKTDDPPLSYQEIPIVEMPISETEVERYTVEEGFDRPGADYENFEQTSEFQSPSLCRDACYSQPKCRSFTYTKPGVAGPKARCWLKNAIPPPVESLCCISGVKGARPPQPAVRKTRLAWQGLDADKVGHENTDGQPDGRPDQHLRLSLTLDSPQEIVSIALHHTDDQGIVKPQNQHWSSRDAQFPVLGVETNGRRLNQSHAPSLGQFSGNVAFDLFAADYGNWEVGSFVLVEVNLADGRKLGHWTQLTPPAGRLIGKWNILCNNSSPQAFEPITLSGRFHMDVQPDSRITGRFREMLLSGTVDQSGAASGTAASSDTAITWSGTIPKPGRNRPLKGNGNFKFERGHQDCFSSGQWWSE